LGDAAATVRRNASRERSDSKRSHKVLQEEILSARKATMTIGVTLALGAVIGVLLGCWAVAGQSSPFLRWSTCWV